MKLEVITPCKEKAKHVFQARPKSQDLNPS